VSLYLPNFYMVPYSARYGSTMTAAGGPLNYISGQRAESSNSNAEDDITVFEPATGYSYMTATSLFKSSYTYFVFS